MIIVSQIWQVCFFLSTKNVVYKGNAMLHNNYSKHTAADVIKAFRLQRNSCFFVTHSQRFSSVGSLRNREVGYLPSDRKSHLIHLNIVRKFFWSSLAYMCTKLMWHKAPLAHFFMRRGTHEMKYNRKTMNC